ncbi:hypothetical protein BDZ45DRAFT_687428 [Acephala macrosclerotiorum]|nr:hypothetical protein BDZ45DRAFT_687428 [Acephala macrosclerotiorum]
MPQLAHCPGQHSYSGGVTISALGNQLNVSLPNLSNTTQTSLSGTIGSFSFPSLLKLDGTFNLYSFYPLGLNFTLLESILVLYLNSNLTSYYHPEKPGLSKGEKIGIGLGVGLPIFIVFVYFLNRDGRKNAARREAKTKPPPPPYDHELDDRRALGVPGHEHAEALPTYRPRTSESTASVSDVSDVSSLSDDGGERSINEHEPPSPNVVPGEEVQRELGIRTGHEGHI